MLTTLRIRNLALVADLSLDLQPGYNAITGETGAGKSILIGALGLVLGERADRSLIRSGSDSCSVEAAFDIEALRAPLTPFLEENGLEPCADGQLLLKRTVTAAGLNRQFVNGSPTTLAILSALGRWLVDIHRPHEHQSLLHPSRQLDILDAFGGLQPRRAEFAEQLRRQKDLAAAKASLIGDEKTLAQQLDLLRFQANEIESAKLTPAEEPELQQEFQRVSNAARLLQLAQTARGLLENEENSVSAQAALLGRTLQELQKVDPGAAALGQLHGQWMSVLDELHRATNVYADRLEIDPARHQELEDRLNLLQGLKRKYGSTVADVIAFGAAARQRVKSLEQRDEEVARLDAELAIAHSQLAQAGQQLSAQRRKLIPKLCRGVCKQLADLGFKQSQFDVAITAEPAAGLGMATYASTGFDRVEFQFAPNPGEDPKPLRAIASSGELARVMLALKTVLAAEDEVPVLIFDEVDANVGGETAHAVGEKMSQIAKQRQVLCITHLAPVAAWASAHYVVSKETQSGRTTSQICLLDAKERINELARMLGGRSEAARLHAEELLRKPRTNG
ncbi:MAG: DNA repair protein RecN [Verrucomicrobiota bacterium]